MKKQLSQPRRLGVFLMALLPVVCTSGCNGGGSGGQGGSGGTATGGAGGVMSTSQSTGAQTGGFGGFGGAMGGSGGVMGGSGGSGGLPICSAESASVDCDDANPCTDDTCPTGSCVYTPSPNGASCGTDLHCDGSGSCVSVKAIWAKRFGTTQGQAGHRIAVDQTGNVAITGSYINVIDFGGGALPQAAMNDGWVAKFDTAGQFVWNRSFNTTKQAGGNDICFDGLGNVINSGNFGATVDFGGGPIVTPSTQGLFTAKYAPDGSHVWSKRFGEAGGVGSILQSDADAVGNVYLTAYYSAGVVDFGCGPLAPAGDYDALVAKLDPAGNCLWSKRWGDSGFQQASAAALDASGNVIIVGILGGTADFGGGPLTSGGGQDVFVAKFDSGGNHLWSKRFGDAANQLGMNVAITDAGNIAVSGWFSGTLDFGGNPMTSAGGEDGFVAMLDAGGNHLWSRRIGSTQYDALRSVAIDKWGNVGIIGYFSGTIDFGAGPLVSTGAIDVVLAKFGGADGKHLWSARFGDSANQLGIGIAYDPTGHTYVVGNFAGSVDFGTGPLVSAGDVDVFVAKFPP